MGDVGSSDVMPYQNSNLGIAPRSTVSALTNAAVHSTPHVRWITTQRHDASRPRAGCALAHVHLAPLEVE